MTFYERLKVLMEQSGTTQKELVGLGINKNSFKYWEKHGNVPNVRILETLAKHFGVSVEFLMTGIDNRNTQAVPDGLPASDELKKLLEESSTLSEEEARKVREYVELLKLKRNQESS